jgi:hypothetical protein
MGIHAASTGGGGRITSIAALIGICVSGVGAGTYCVATALLPDPKPAIRSEANPAKRHTPVSRRVSKPKAKPTATRVSSSAQPGGISGSRVTAAQTPKVVPKRTGRKRTPSSDEFSFETGARPSTSQPTAAASTKSTSAGQTGSSGGFESGPTTGSTSSGEFGDRAGGEFSP